MKEMRKSVLTNTLTILFKLCITASLIKKVKKKNYTHIRFGTIV